MVTPRLTCQAELRRARGGPLVWDEIDVDGRPDATRAYVEYIGKAKRQSDGTYRALARIGHALCVVACTIHMRPG